MKNAKKVFVGLLLLSQFVVASSKKEINWNPVQHFKTPYESYNSERVGTYSSEAFKDKLKRLPRDEETEYFRLSNSYNSSSSSSSSSSVAATTLAHQKSSNRFDEEQIEILNTLIAEDKLSSSATQQNNNNNTK